MSQTLASLGWFLAGVYLVMAVRRSDGAEELLAVPEAGWQVRKGSIWDFIGILTLDLASRTVKE